MAIAISMALLCCGAAARVSDNSVPDVVLAHFRAFVGRWSTSAATFVGQQAYPLKATMNCAFAAARTAVLCTANLNDRMEVMMLGYNIGSKAIWSQVVDSHDGATVTTGAYTGETLRLTSVSGTSNSKMPVVLDAITFATNGKSWSDIGSTSIDGKTVASWNLTWKRVD